MCRMCGAVLRCFPLKATLAVLLGSKKSPMATIHMPFVGGTARSCCVARPCNWSSREVALMPRGARLNSAAIQSESLSPAAFTAEEAAGLGAPPQRQVGCLRAAEPQPFQRWDIERECDS